MFGGLLVIVFSNEESRRRRCGNGGKVGAFFAKAFPNSLWKSSQKKLPKATVVDFHSCGGFHSAFRRALFVLRFGLQKEEAPGYSLEPKTRVINQLCSGANQ